MNGFGQIVPAFGGDFSGVVPCLDPTDPTTAPRQRNAQEENAGCLPGSFATTSPGGVTQYGDRVTSPQNVRFIGGRGEAPFRPAPDLASTALGNAALLDAQGLYVPSVGLRRTLRSGDLDELRLNISETDRSWNRGASQQRTKELKEAYVDLETMEHRLWLRLGLQNIVWGKTEVFRTTDQFNPQDLGLSSLPTLEESRSRCGRRAPCTRSTTSARSKDVRLEVPRTSTASSRPTSARAASRTRRTRCARSRTASRRTRISASASRASTGRAARGTTRPISRSAGASSGGGTALRSR
jgi:hypothetical protein